MFRTGAWKQCLQSKCDVPKKGLFKFWQTGQREFLFQEKSYVEDANICPLPVVIFACLFKRERGSHYENYVR